MKHGPPFASSADLIHNTFQFFEWRVLVLIVLVVALFPTNSHAQRVALVIGNANYTTGRLTNPPNDVVVMEAALKKLNFKVQTVLNANQNQMKRAVRDFGTSAQGAEVAFMYYSGHGTQAQGENYLLPVGASIEKESDYEVEAVSANAVLRQIQGARPKAAILVLDACRDNPMAAITRSGTKGLSRMDAPTGTMIAFATAPNTTASDNGDYAKVLAKELQKPGQELIDVFRNTTAEVRRLSAGKQEPRISEMSISDRLYLAGQGTQLASVAVEPTGRPVQTDPEQEAWELAKRRDTAASYKAYLDVYPNGRFAGTATVALGGLQPTANSKPTVASNPASTTSLTTNIQAGNSFKDCAECPEMVVIPAGNFMMGANRAFEKPVHSVSIKSFAMGKTQVTQGQWQALMGSNPSHFSQCGLDCPVEKVSWNDAQAYVQKLNQKSGKLYRLPSEAEWEYACRAGSRHEYCGSDNLDSVAWYGNNNGRPGGNSGQTTHIVAGKKANAFGLYDMTGNVWQWVEDYYHDTYSGAPTDGSAWTIEANQIRVLRGGSWDTLPDFMRSTYRIWNFPDIRYYYYGFRVARTLLTP